MLHRKKLSLAGVALLLTGVFTMVLTSGTGPLASARPTNSSSQVVPLHSGDFLATPDHSGQRNVSQDATLVRPSVLNSAQAVTTAPDVAGQPASNPVFIQQRDQLYRDFERINTGLSQGQQPDFREVSALLSQQQQLVKAGILSIEEAVTYSQFLRQVLPAMDHQLTRHIQQLEQQKRLGSQHIAIGTGIAP